MNELIHTLPLIDRAPSFSLTAGSRTLRRKVREIQQRHPDWEPEAIQRALFRQGFAVLLPDVRQVVEKDPDLEGLRPLRLVKYELGLA
ncbi:hypothetical protein Mesil_3664 (plasmid) [Allomeiothermus silvanus DSM 9946]|uniref:Uncharacterized protein n=1 Tax=Allomeiothermus silvanus (strain ATCC 700542 / DSM 9946 / NBRC 106475 / NCIMB 13440 / VI-R2) TaxID=526227 RepID=D7BJU4_ALLS1|nr:hypothetical protein [Allomeiothermus silvanus]ADH65450.1 hypothetical protein Mesil_3664 [Allomeiothermus silvanus DSM 9946]